MTVVVHFTKTSFPASASLIETNRGLKFNLRMGCGVKANFVDGEIASSSEVCLQPYYSAAVTQIRIICVSNSDISSAKQNKNISNSSILSANHCNSEVTWIRSRINDSCFEDIETPSQAEESGSNLYLVEINNAAYQDDFLQCSVIFIEKKSVEWAKNEFL